MLMVFLGHVRVAGMSLDRRAELAESVHTAGMLLQLDHYQCFHCLFMELSELNLSVALDPKASRSLEEQL